MEAGASLMLGRRAAGPLGRFPSLDWQESNTLIPAWNSGQTTIQDLRRWASPLVLGSPPVAQFTANNLHWKRNPRLWLRLYRHRRRARRQ